MKDIHIFFNNLVNLLDKKHPWEDQNVQVNVLKFGDPGFAARIILTNHLTQDELTIGFDDKGYLQFYLYDVLNNGHITDKFESLNLLKAKECITKHLKRILGL